jgi:hypothetical protein
LLDRRAILLSLSVLAAGGSQAATGKPYRAPRNAFGAPDLEGCWTNASYTELQRPDELKTLVATPQQARDWEARLAKTGGVNVPEDPLGQATSEFPETGAGLLRIGREIRTSLIVDPADGKIPYSAAAKARLHIGDHAYRRGYDDVEVRPFEERCLISGSSGAPILPSADANLLQIVQTPRAVVILTERYHDARVIPLGASAWTGPPSWMGWSTGRWAGDTLQVATAGFRAGVTEHGDDLYLSGETQVTERFTRIGPRQILYAFTVVDPSLFTRPWRAEMVLNATAARVFEYACHEGNYSLPSILSAARQGHQPGPQKAAAPKGAP